MEINEKMMRDLRRKFDVEMNKKEIEIVDHWKQEIESVYRKKYDSLAAVQTEMKRVIERMGNRISILTKMVREES
jgi:phosphopantetheine adenylyltransferase